jgi:hypothetical protein
MNCERCGECCKLPSGKDCKYLFRFSNGKTACKVYKTRLGRSIGEDCFCSEIGKNGTYCRKEKTIINF